MVHKEDIVTITEAAEALGYTVQHTRLLLRQGRLQGTKIGRDWLVVRESIAEYVVHRSTSPLIPSHDKQGQIRTPRKPRALS